MRIKRIFINIHVNSDQSRPEFRTSPMAYIAFAIKATQRAVRRRKQPTLTVLHSSARCALQVLSRMNDAAQPRIFVYMHAWTDTLAREGLWLANHSAASDFQDDLILPITILNSKGTHGFKLITVPTAEICSRHADSTHNLTSALPLRKLPHVRDATRTFAASNYFRINLWSKLPSLLRSIHTHLTALPFHGLLAVRYLPGCCPLCVPEIRGLGFAFIALFAAAQSCATQETTNLDATAFF